MQSTFKTIRIKIFDFIFEKSRIGYVKTVKRNKDAWNISKASLLKFPKASFGYQYATFLEDNNFDILTKIERHDAYHIICNYPTNTPDEIALQYLCLGNGKRNFYVFGIILLGSLLLPEHWKYYRNSFRIGKQANPFHNWNFQELLHHNLTDLQEVVFSKSILSKIIIN